MSGTANDQPPRGAQLVARAFDLLRAISRFPQNGCRLSDLSKVTGLKEATARRILRSLIYERMVFQEPQTRRYRLGPLAFELGLVQNPYQTTIRRCEAFLRATADETGDTAFLCMRSGTELVCLARSEGHFPIRASMVAVGGRLPLGVGGLGVSLLAGLDDLEVSRLLDALERDFSRFPDLNRSTVEDRIADARRIGYSIFVDQPIRAVLSIGVAVPNDRNPPVLGIATVAIVQRFTKEHIERTVQALKVCAEQVSLIHRDNAGTAPETPG